MTSGDAASDGNERDEQGDAHPVAIVGIVPDEEPLAGRRRSPPHVVFVFVVVLTVVLVIVDKKCRGSTRKNVIFSNSLWTNSEYPNSLKSMSIWSL